MPKYNAHWIFTKECFDVSENLKINPDLIDYVQPNKTYELKGRFKVLISKDDVHFVTHQDCLISYSSKPYYLGVDSLDGGALSWNGDGLTSEQQEIVKECLKDFETNFFPLSCCNNLKANLLDQLIEDCLNEISMINRQEIYELELSSC